MGSPAPLPTSQAFHNVLAKCAILRQVQPSADTEEEVAHLNAILDLNTHVNNLLEAHRTWRRYLNIGRHKTQHGDSARSSGSIGNASGREDPQNVAGCSTTHGAGWGVGLRAGASSSAKESDQSKAREVTYRLNEEVQAKLWGWLRRHVE